MYWIAPRSAWQESAGARLHDTRAAFRSFALGLGLSLVLLCLILVAQFRSLVAARRRAVRTNRPAPPHPEASRGTQSARADVLLQVDRAYYAILRDRPELAGLRLEEGAAQRFARAERALMFPTLSAVASAGVIPSRDLPVLNGGLFRARREAAELRAREAGEKRGHQRKATSTWARTILVISAIG